MKLTIEQPTPKEAVTAADQVEWTSLRTLSPGMDFVDDVLYITVPTFIKTTKKTKQGDETIYEPVVEVKGGCVTSEGEFFMFDRTNLYERGFLYPKTFMPNEEGWGGELAKRYTRGETKAPDTWDLYMRIRDLYVKYIEFADEMYYDIMTSYVMATHVFKIFDTFGYLHFNGTAASGKSQNLRILAAIAFNATWTANMTAASLYRGVSGNPGMLCIDESESFQGERGEALREILKTGYYKGVQVSRERQQSDNMWVSDKFNTFSPKALASINPLDPVTQQRTLVIGMRPAIRNIPEFERDTEEGQAILNDLHLFALANAKDIAVLYRHWREKVRYNRAPNLANRAWEITAPIIILAEYVGGDTISDPMIDWLSKYYEDQRKKSDSTDLIRLLAISLPSYIKETMAHDEWFYPVATILDNLKSFMDDDTTEKVSTRSIIRWLTPLGFANVRAAKGGKQIQIKEEDLRAVFRERRIDPRDDDVAWLNEKVSYQTPERRVQKTVQNAIGWDT